MTDNEQEAARVEELRLCIVNDGGVDAEQRRIALARKTKSNAVTRPLVSWTYFVESWTLIVDDWLRRNASLYEGGDTVFTAREILLASVALLDHYTELAAEHDRIAAEREG